MSPAPSRRSVMSRVILAKPIRLPSSSRMASITTLAKKRDAVLTHPPTFGGESARCGSGCESLFGNAGRAIRRPCRSSEKCRPTISFSAYPLMRWAPAVPARHHPWASSMNQGVVGDGLGKQPELPFALAQRLRRQFLRRDVAADDVDQSVFHGQRPVEPAPRPVLVAKAVFHAHGRHTGGKLLAPRRRMRRVVGMAQLADVHAA